MSYQLQYEFGSECKFPVKSFLSTTNPQLIAPALDIYGENTARIFRTLAGKVEQGLFITFLDHKIEARLALQSYEAPSSDLYDGLCALCSSRYISEHDRPLIQIFHSFELARHHDILAALQKSRLNQYQVTGETIVIGKLVSFTQTINYWKFT